MSTNLNTLQDRNGNFVQVTRFFGGSEDGTCVQLNNLVRANFAVEEGDLVCNQLQFTRQQAADLVVELTRFLASDFQN